MPIVATWMRLGAAAAVAGVFLAGVVPSASAVVVAPVSQTLPMFEAPVGPPLASDVVATRVDESSAVVTETADGALPAVLAYPATTEFWAVTLSELWGSYLPAVEQFLSTEMTPSTYADVRAANFAFQRDAYAALLAAAEADGISASAALADELAEDVFPASVEVYGGFFGYAANLSRIRGATPLYVDTDGSGRADALEEIEQNWDDVYAVIEDALGDPDEATQQTYEALVAAFHEWQDSWALSYIAAFQSQVSEYLAIVQELGYVRDESTGALVLGTPGSGLRALTLADIDDIGTFGVDSLFLEQNLVDGTTDPLADEWLTPEQVVASSWWQSKLFGINVGIDSISPVTRQSVTFILQYASNSTFQFLSDSGPGGGFASTPLSTLGVLLEQYSFDAAEAGVSAKPLPDWLAGGDVLPFDQALTTIHSSRPVVTVEQATDVVTRTINYRFEDGRVCVPPGASEGGRIVQSVTFSRATVQPAAIELPRAPATADLPARANPSCVHPDSDATVGTPAELVESTTVLPGADDDSITVTYPLSYTVTIRYVDAAGKALAPSRTITGGWNTFFTTGALDVERYSLVSSGQASGVYGFDRDDIVFVYDLVAGGPTPDPTDEPTEELETPQGSLASTGGTVPMLVVAGGVLAVIVGAVTVVAVRRRTVNP